MARRGPQTVAEATKLLRTWAEQALEVAIDQDADGDSDAAINYAEAKAYHCAANTIEKAMRAEKRAKR